MVVILILGISIFLAYRRKFKKMDGFEGIVTERGKRSRRQDFDWSKEEKQMSDR